MSAPCHPMSDRPVGPAARSAAAETVNPTPTALPAWLPALGALARREWRQAWQRPGELVWHAGFFVMVAGLFPLTVQPEPAQLMRLGPGVVWMAALLAVLLATGRVFHDDLRSGWLDQCALAAGQLQMPLALMMAVRMAVQWVLVAGPLLPAAPLIGLQYGMGLPALAVLLLSLALGLAVLVPLACVAAALAAGLRSAALLSLLMVLPLAAPALVFGSLAVQAAQRGDSAAAELSLLAAMAALTAVAGPVLGALAWRSAIES